MKTYTHTDKLGRDLEVNDTVAYSSFYGGLTIARVDALNRVRVRLVRLGDTKFQLAYEDISPGEVVKVDSRDVTVYLLKNQK